MGINAYVILEEITDLNREEKFLKAVKDLSFKLGVPATIQHKDKSGSEKYPFQAQKDLVDGFIEKRGYIMDDLYSRLCATLGLPVMQTFTKGLEISEEYMMKAVTSGARSLLRSKIQFNPSAGQYITGRNIDDILDAIDNFLNKNTRGTANEIVIDTAAASRVLANMTKDDGYSSASDIPLSGLAYKKKPFRDITKQLDKIFTPSERQKLQKYTVVQYIAGINDDTRNSIGKIITNGMSAGKTNGEISQELFDKFGSLNKDWNRIVDTETTNIFDDEYIAEQVSWGEPGEKTYFKRVEFAGGNICEFCAQALSNDIIALYVENPMGDDKIDDPVASIAVWPGKSNVSRKRSDWWFSMGAIHPSCRGYWERYYPEEK